MHKILAFQPELQVPLGAWACLHEADSRVAPFVLPGHFAHKFHCKLGAGKGEVDPDWADCSVRLLQSHSDTTLTEIHQMGPLAVLGAVRK